MKNIVQIDPGFHWKKHDEANNISVHSKGSGTCVEQIFNYFKKQGFKSDLTELETFLKLLKGNFGVILETENTVFAAADKISSYHICYYHENNDFTVSNTARMNVGKKRMEIEDNTILEFEMSGYVSGRNTIYKYLYQLQAGEYIIWDKNRNKLIRNRYFVYYPEAPNLKTEKDLIDEFEDVNNTAFQRMIDELDGRPVWIPLSGGLDSRLVLCKLDELGYDNIQTYSYGPQSNYEAKVAKIVAEKINVPWQFIPIYKKDIQAFYWSENRKEYEQFSDNLSTIPVIQDISALIKTENKKLIPDNAVFINGQSGDYITGGHIPAHFKNSDISRQDMLDAIWEKHYSLWENLKTSENKNKIFCRIEELIHKEFIKVENKDLYKALEYWEWQERQCKYVVNGIRLYEFLGYTWKMPLWADEYLLFWRDVPLNYKLNQYLYKKYLVTYNYKNVFKNFKHTIWRWPGLTMGFVGLAQVIKAIAGQKAQENFYKYVKYFGHYRFAYGAYRYSYYFKYAKTARNPISFFVKTWLKENIQS